jgi:hypothetical protein
LGCCRKENDGSLVAPVVDNTKYTINQQREFNAMYNIIKNGKSKTAPSTKSLQNAVFGFAAEGLSDERKTEFSMKIFKLLSQLKCSQITNTKKSLVV